MKSPVVSVNMKEAYRMNIDEIPGYIGYIKEARIT
jgi:hypothetical protein